MKNELGLIIKGRDFSWFIQTNLEEFNEVANFISSFIGKYKEHKILTIPNYVKGLDGFTKNDFEKSEFVYFNHIPLEDFKPLLLNAYNEHKEKYIYSSS